MAEIDIPCTLLCICGGPLVSAGPPMLSTPCGHTTCSECWEAVALTGANVCAVCGEDIHSSVVNTALSAVLLGMDTMTTTESMALCQTETAPAASAEFNAAPAPSFFDGWPLRCWTHGDREAFCYCPQECQVLCMECMMADHIGHAVIQHAETSSLLADILPRFTRAAADMSASATAAGIDATEALRSSEHAAMQAKEMFANLREALARQEACLLQALGAEGRRRSKAFQVQAVELEVGAAQADAVASAGRRALMAPRDLVGIVNVLKLATRSEGLLTPALFPKENPLIACRLDVAGVCRILDESGVASGGALDSARVCARGCYSASQHDRPIAAAWRQLLEVFDEHHFREAVAAMAFCRAATVLIDKGKGTVVNWCEYIAGDIFQRFAGIVLPATADLDASQAMLCEVWCLALASLVTKNIAGDTLAPFLAAFRARVVTVLEQSTGPDTVMCFASALKVWWALTRPGSNRRAVCDPVVSLCWNRMVDLLMPFPNQLVELFGPGFEVPTPAFVLKTVDVMQAHPTHEMLQARCLDTLGSDTFVMTAFDEAVGLETLAPRMVEVMLQAMGLHPRSSPVHQGALKLLRRVSGATRGLRPVIIPSVQIADIVAGVLAQPQFCLRVYRQGIFALITRNDVMELTTAARRTWYEEHVVRLLSPEAPPLDVWTGLTTLNQFSLFLLCAAEKLWLEPIVAAAVNAHVGVEPIQFAGHPKRLNLMNDHHATADTIILNGLRAHSESSRLRCEAFGWMTFQISRPRDATIDAIHAELVLHPCSADVAVAVCIWFRCGRHRHDALDRMACDLIESINDEGQLGYAIESFCWAAFPLAGRGPPHRWLLNRMAFIVQRALERYPGLRQTMRCADGLDCLLKHL